MSTESDDNSSLRVEGKSDAGSVSESDSEKPGVEITGKSKTDDKIVPDSEAANEITADGIAGKDFGKDFAVCETASNDIGANVPGVGETGVGETGVGETGVNARRGGEKAEKGVRKRRRKTPEGEEEVDDGLWGTPEGESIITCSTCGSRYTRRSRSPSSPIVAFTKGTLYRCRNCKAHFRVRDSKTVSVIAGVGTGVAFLALIVFIVVSSFWGDIVMEARTVADWLPSFNLFKKTSGASVSSQTDGKPQSLAENLTDRVHSIFLEAQSFQADLPVLQASYENFPIAYEARLDAERKRAGNADSETLTRQLSAISAAMASNLESQHQKTVAAITAFRQKLDPVMRDAAAFEGICTNLSDKVSAAANGCNTFENEYSILKAKSPIILAGFASVEQAYLDARRAMDGVAMPTNSKAAAK